MNVQFYRQKVGLQYSFCVCTLGHRVLSFQLLSRMSRELCPQREINSSLNTSHYQCIRNKDFRFTVQSFTKLYIIYEPLLQAVNLRRALLLLAALVEVVLVDLDLLGVPGLAAVGGRETIRGGASQAEGVAESRVSLVEVNGDVLPAWRITSSASNSCRHLKARGELFGRSLL